MMSSAFLVHEGFAAVVPAVDERLDGGDEVFDGSSIFSVECR
jgi:hypothetical protein